MISKVYTKASGCRLLATGKTGRARWALPIVILLSAFYLSAADPAPPKFDIYQIQKRLRLDDPKAVEAAADELVASKHPEAAATLMALYNDISGEKRMIAVRFLGILAPKGKEDFFYRIAIGDIFQTIRHRAAVELAKLEGEDRAVNRLMKCVKDEKKFPALYRQHAVQCIGQIGGKKAHDTLQDLLRNAEPEVVVAAAEGLGRSRDLSRVAPLVDALNSSDPEVKPAVADALEALTGEKFRFDLVKWSAWLKELPKSLPDAPAPSMYSQNWPGVSLDVVIVFDTTGSMVHAWPLVATCLSAVLRELEKLTPSPRVGVIKYRAARPEDALRYMIQTTQMTRQMPKIHDELTEASFGGGSGALHLGMQQALAGMTWRANSKKIVIVVGDTTPEGGGVRNCMRLVRDAELLDGVQTNTIYIRTSHGEEHRDTYGYIARIGSGRFYEFNKAEKHLVEWTAETVSIKESELPAVTAKKLCTPREKK